MGDVEPSAGRQDPPHQPRRLPAAQPEAQDAHNLRHPLTLLHHQLNYQLTGASTAAGPEWFFEGSETEMSGGEEWGAEVTKWCPGHRPQSPAKR